MCELRPMFVAVLARLLVGSEKLRTTLYARFKGFTVVLHLLAKILGKVTLFWQGDSAAAMYKCILLVWVALLVWGFRNF